MYPIPLNYQNRSTNYQEYFGYPFMPIQANLSNEMLQNYQMKSMQDRNQSITNQSIILPPCNTPDTIQSCPQNNQMYYTPIYNPHKRILKVEWIDIMATDEKSVPIKRKRIDDTTDIPEDAITDFNNINAVRIKCNECNKEVFKSDCVYTQNDKEICCDCAAKYPSISCFVDKEIKYKCLSDDVKRCDRLKHLKKKCSFIKYKFKGNKYELSSLCSFCRNIKRIEYLKKRACKD